jgi:hypothetical protein
VAAGLNGVPAAAAVAPPAGAAGPRRWLERGPWLRRAVVAAVALLGVGGMLLWYFKLRPGPFDTELRYLPSGCEAVYTMRVGDLLQSEAYRKANSKETDKGEEEFERIWGVPLRAVSRMTVAHSYEASREEISLEELIGVIVKGHSRPSPTVLILQTRRRIDAAALAEARQQSCPADHPITYKPVSVGDFTLYEPEGADDASRMGPYNVAFSVPEPRLVVFGGTDTLRKVLERNGKAQLSEGMEEALANVDFSHSLVFVEKRQRTPDGSWLPPFVPEVRLVAHSFTFWEPLLADALGFSESPANPPFDLSPPLVKHEALDKLKAPRPESGWAFDYSVVQVRFRGRPSNTTILFCKRTEEAKALEKAIWAKHNEGRSRSGHPREYQDPLFEFKVKADGNKVYWQAHEKKQPKQVRPSRW